MVFCLDETSDSGSELLSFESAISRLDPGILLCTQPCADSPLLPIKDQDGVLPRRDLKFWVWASQLWFWGFWNSRADSDFILFLYHFLSKVIQNPKSSREPSRHWFCILPCVFCKSPSWECILSNRCWNFNICILNFLLPSARARSLAQILLSFL